MAHLFHNVRFPLFSVVRSGATRDICDTLACNNVTFRQALIICGTGRTHALAGEIARSLEAGGLSVHIHCIAGGAFSEVDQIKHETIESFFPDVLLGVGGGSVIDVTKLAAAEKRLPWISIPTSASNDGFCSPVAVLSANHGRKSVGASIPLGVIADLSVLLEAPRRLLLAGVGDLISNVSAVADWELAEKCGKASVNNIARMLALAGACQVIASVNPRIDDPDFLQLVVEGLLLSGLAMEVSGSSRPCSGAEHLISHAIDAAGVGNALHGEQVGIATFYCLALHQIDPAPLQRFAAQIGMMMTPQDVSISRGEFLQAVENAPSMRVGRWTVLSSARARKDAEAIYDACFGAQG
jgi:glycerol-1-phosphate dehydrogenase [NAD(P)+]